MSWRNIILGLTAAGGMAAGAGCRLGSLASPKIYGSISDADLTLSASHENRPMKLSELKGAPWIASFLYTTCAGPCPMLAAQLARLQWSLPDDVKLVSFTVDPEKDTPARLSAYARRFQADPERWFFLSGPTPALNALFRDSFKIALAENPKGPPGTQLIHSTKLVLVDSQGSVRGYYDSDQAGSLASLRQDAKKLLKK
ncbi:MAG: SCO family protein [Elusimicrobia bacterium]|nr:SCO family protein [Elusimicrobiota bacterium]